MPTATALDLITASLVELNVVAAGEVVPSADALLGLASLNRLIDGWRAESLQVYTVTRSTWTIVSGTQDYTVGTGGTVNILRPVYIDHVNFIDTSADPDLEYQMSYLTDDAWSMVPQKALTSPLPTSAYYNPTFPLGTLSLWPIPTSSTLLGAIYYGTTPIELAALTTSVSLPPGYQRMIVKNLALDMSPSYSRQADQMLMQHAMDSKAIVKRSNKRLSDLAFERGALIQGAGGSMWWDIRTGP